MVFTQNELLQESHLDKSANIKKLKASEGGTTGDNTVWNAGFRIQRGLQKRQQRGCNST